jgi:transposase
MHLIERDAGDLDTLKRRTRVERDAEQRDRLRVVILAIEGLQTADIQRMLGRSRGFVQRWAYAYRDDGLGAVARTPHPGRPARLPAARLDELRARIDAGPTPADGVCTLRGKDVQRIIRDEMGVELSLQSAYNTLHRMGYSCLAPRPRHERQDLATQKKFKEESAPLL